MLDQLTKWRRELHRMPEVGLELPKTHAYLREQLGDIDAQIEAVAGYGLTLFFDLGFSDAIGFRADMDALAITEAHGAPYRSAHEGSMHACGHDGHMAMLLALAHWVDAHRAELNHNVLLIFQPGEELWGGGQMMADANIIERHHVRSVFALHVDPHLAVGQVGSKPGAFMARPSDVKLVVHGRSTHVARADEGIDALMAGAEFCRRAAEMVDEFQSRDPKALKFGLVRAGTAPNIIADRLEMHGSMRTFAREDCDHMTRSLLEIAAEIERETGARMEVSIVDGCPAVINDAALFELARARLLDMDFVTFDRPVLMSEDFSCFMERAPGLMLYIGVGSAPLHSPEFDFDERALEAGVEVLKRLCAM